MMCSRVKQEEVAHLLSLSCQLGMSSLCLCLLLTLLQFLCTGSACRKLLLRLQANLTGQRADAHQSAFEGWQQ